LRTEPTLAVSFSDLKHLFDDSEKCRTHPVRPVVWAFDRTDMRSNGCTIELSFDAKEAEMNAMSAATAQPARAAQPLRTVNRLHTAKRPRVALPPRPHAQPLQRGSAGALRLTRRGRIVLTGFAALAATAVWLAAADAAQATNHGAPPQTAERNLSQVVVRPDETLWSIALRAEPGADPRVVVQRIVEINALSGQVIVPGQRLWVPKG
jgi:hypothetical protein